MKPAARLSRKPARTSLVSICRAGDGAELLEIYQRGCVVGLRWRRGLSAAAKAMALSCARAELERWAAKRRAELGISETAEAGGHHG